MTAKEAAAMLRVSVNHVYDLAREGALPCVKLGRSVRFSRRRLEQLLEQGDQGEDQP